MGFTTQSTGNSRTGAADNQKPHLTHRTPDEILKMMFDPADLYLENGVFARSQPMTLLGPGGVGKSRLVVQLAVCLIIGRAFLGWKVSECKTRWLIIQAENSNRRLQSDLKKMRAWVGEALWPLVQENLVIHTLEKDHDSFLSIADQASAELLARLINEVAADVVVFDPLLAFATGNLNTDAAMLKTCKTIAELARRGKADSAIVVLHHTLTGKDGAKKATGYDRASYGRGSKALHLWTRGQINVAATKSDTNDSLVISCGKNSNGPEFEPFGIKLHPVTMVYEVDPEFDLAAWQNQLKGETNSAIKPTPEAVAAFVKDLPLTRKELVNLIMEEFGCGKSAAYALIARAEGTTIKRNAKKQYEAISTTA